MDVHLESDAARYALPTNGAASQFETIDSGEFGNLCSQLLYWGVTIGCCGFTGCTCLYLPIDQRLTLGPEEAILTTKTCLSKSVQRRPYGELGAVDISRTCGCCWGVRSGIGSISPGWGCEQEKVERIHAELKKRQQARGDQGQIQRAEQNVLRLISVESKLDAIIDHLNINYTPAVAPVGASIVRGDMQKITT